ncbi:MAG: hypothetical protein HQM13_14005 [SAR324 cluster bacterium]|nr:hypothetical protein [SAR324 cluster bacterium]
MRSFVLFLSSFFLLGCFFLTNAMLVSESRAQNSPDMNIEGDAEEEGFGDEGEDEGFGDEEGDAFQEIEIEAAVQNVVVDKGYVFGGFVKEDLAYSFHEPDSAFKFTRTEAELNKIRLTLNLYLEFDLSEEWEAKISGNSFYDAYYAEKGREKFPNETLDAYERELDLRDTFVEGPLSEEIRIKIGRQIIAWGESEGLAIIDMANPRDNLELGLVDIEDARIPVFATKLSYLSGTWEGNLVAIHEFRSNKNATEGSDFDPFISIRGAFPVKKEELPEEETEWLARFFKSFNGGDLSLVYADVFEDNPYLDFESFAFTPRYQRIKTFGVSGNLVRGSWLFKLEMARKRGAAFGRNDLEKQLRRGLMNPKSWSEKDMTQLMLGFDYSGVTDLSATFEFNITKIEDYPNNLANQELRAAPSLNLRYDTWNNTLHPQFLWVRLPNDNGDLYRLSGNYDYIDALRISVGIAVYDASKTDDLLYPYRHNDRVFGGVKYSF